MKISKIAIILILAILAISAVSASDSSQDTLNSTDEVSDILLDDEDMFEEYADGTGTQDSHMNITWPDEIKVGEFPEIKYELPNDADYSSHVVVYIDNERIDDGQYPYQTSYPIFIDEYVTYTLMVKFTGDNKYAPYVESKTYNVNDFIFTIQVLNISLGKIHQNNY